MDIDGVALVTGAGETDSFQRDALLFLPCLKENSTLISYLIGSGIGREVALTLAAHGAHTIICSDIDIEAAKQTAEMSQHRKASHLTEYKVHALHVDVRDEDSVQQMVNVVKWLFDRIDYFVNTAGVSSNIVTPFKIAESDDGIGGAVLFYVIHSL